MPKYKLTYFPLAARAEVLRLTLEVGGADWEDIRVTQEQWKDMSAKATSSKPFRFPWLPWLEVDPEDENKRICISQSLPALRFVARKLGLDGETDREKCEVESILDIYNDLFNAYIGIVFSPQPDDLVEKFLSLLTKEGDFLERILKGNGSGYLVGKKLTVADVAIYSVLREASTALGKTKKSIDWTKLPSLKAHHQKIASEPKIKAYYSK